MKKIIVLIFLIFSYSASSQSFDEKIEGFISISYQKIDLKVDFLLNPNSVNDIHIDEYTFGYEVKNDGREYKLKDTTQIVSHILKYEDGKLKTNFARVEGKNFFSTSTFTEQMERIMTYDSSGRLSKILTTFQGKEKTVTIQKFKYSNDIIERVYYTEKDTINPDDEMYRYRVDNDNYVIEESILMDKHLKYFDFKYNQKKDQIFTNYGRYDIKSEHTYDDSGNKIQTSFTCYNKYDGTIEYTGIEKFVYDNNNNLIKEISAESDNVTEYKYKDNRLVELNKLVKGKISSKKKYKYDRFGNWIEIEFMETSFEGPLYTDRIAIRKINYK